MKTIIGDKNFRINIIITFLDILAAIASPFALSYVDGLHAPLIMGITIVTLFLMQMVNIIFSLYKTIVSKKWMFFLLVVTEAVSLIISAIFFVIWLIIYVVVC